jgi:long-chain acyl-CoA synthetase
VIEDVLRAHPGVLDVAVGVAGDDPRGDAVVAVVESGSTPAPGPESLRAVCVRELPPALRPRRFRFVQAMPRLGNGKPDRRAIRRLAES